MRVTGLVLAAFLVTAPAFGQNSSAAADRHPYGLDPYSPTDAAFLRKFAPTLIGQTPILELRKLDPYKPSHAALLRQDAALPVWATWWAPVPPASGSLRVFPSREAAAPVRPAPPARDAATPPPGPTDVATAIRPEANDGIHITYAQQRWVSAGRAVPMDSGFTRVGSYRGVDVYRRALDPPTVIFVQGVRDGRMLVPYRVKQ
jgi:hypothetical protein